jgi:hypothetical protein
MLRNKMTTFENDLKQLTANLHKYSLIEFYHEEFDLKQNIKKMSDGLESF